MPRRAHPVRGYLYIASAAFLWGIAATLGRAAFTGRLLPKGQTLRPIDPLILSQSRATFSFLVLLFALVLLRGRKRLRVPLADFRRMFVLGILGVAASNFFYFYAIEKTTVALAIVLQYVAPVWVLLYMLARRLQRPTARRISGVILAVIGCGLAVGGIAAQRVFPWLAISGPRFDTLGVIAAEMAAISFAFYNVYGQHLLQLYDRWTVLLYALLGAALFWLIVNPPWKIIAQHYSRGQWTFMAVFAITSMLVPFSLYFTGLQYLDPTRAIVTACLEPVWAILLTALLLGELVSPMQVVGIVIVLSATILIQRQERKNRSEPTITVEPIE